MKRKAPSWWESTRSFARKMNRDMSQKPILLIGGYGIHGEKIARLLRRRHPRLPLLIGGRTPEKADALAGLLGNAEGVKIDLYDPLLGIEHTDFWRWGSSPMIPP